MEGSEKGTKKNDVREGTEKRKRKRLTEKENKKKIEAEKKGGLGEGHQKKMGMQKKRGETPRKPDAHAKKKGNGRRKKMQKIREGVSKKKRGNA